MSLLLGLCTTASVWDAFVADSPQGSIFCQTVFLDALGVEYDLWLVEKDGRPQAGGVILRRNDEPLCSPYPFTMYQGILFAGHSCTMPQHRRSKWTLEVTDSLLRGLSERYQRISFCLHYRVSDLRSFQWFHYHEPSLGQFKTDLYYTGLIDLKTSPDFETYLGAIRKVRRYEYRRALGEGSTAEVSQDIDTLEYLHRLTFERQGLKRSEGAECLLRNIATVALARGFGELLICRNVAGDAASATLFLYDEQCGYYLFGANDPAHRSTGSGTFLLLENIQRCWARGLKWVDVCGINSPNRGDFKASFNAVPLPYFVVTWDRPRSITS